MPKTVAFKAVQLLSNYQDLDGLYFENVAISDKNEDSYLFRLNSNGEKKHPHYQGLGTLNQDVLVQFNRKYLPEIEAHILKEQVRCVLLDDLLEKYNISAVDLLHIDAEGHDSKILHRQIKEIGIPSINFCLKDDGFEIKVLPTWRPDKAMAVENPTTYNKYVDQLASVADVKILSYTDLLTALKKRHDFFANMGCRLSDHGVETLYAEDYTRSEIDSVFKKVRGGDSLDKTEILKFKSAMMYDFGIMDHEKGWTQQFHYGAMRNNNTRLFNQLGPDTGFDSIGDYEVGIAMSKFFDRLDMEDKLAKTIIYNLNPRDNELIATMIGNFQDGSVAGKMQFGSGWWFLDQKDGMEKQMNALSNLGLLSRFIGMLTDSRSFLSYPRHEYFRRILCNLIGSDVENGLIPNDKDLLGKMVENISYYNAKNFFNF